MSQLKQGRPANVKPPAEIKSAVAAAEIIHHVTDGDALLIRLEAGEKTPDKNYRWKKSPATFPQVIAHLKGGGDFGINPQSIGLIIVDVDEGNAAEIIAAHPPLFYVKTGRAGGYHLFYRMPARAPRKNRKFNFGSCAGDLIYTGYGKIHNPLDFADRLASSITADPREERGWFPLEIFPCLHVPAAAAAKCNLTRPSDPRLAAGGDLSHVQEGDRNNSLFYELRKGVGHDLFHSGRTDRLTLVQAAHELNVTFPQPLPPDEVEKTAKSVHPYLRQLIKKYGRNYFRFTWRPEEQARKGKLSGRARRAAKAPLIKRAAAMHAAGLSMRAIAKKLEVSKSTICNWINVPVTAGRAADSTRRRRCAERATGSTAGDHHRRCAERTTCSTAGDHQAMC